MGLAMPVERFCALLAAVPSALWRGVLAVSSLLILFCVQRRQSQKQATQRRLLKQTHDQHEKRQAHLRSLADSLAENEDELEWQIERAELGSSHPRF